MFRKIRIAQNLPQFKDENSLLIVTGEKAMEIYRAQDGIIENVLSYRVADPKHRDRSGNFAKRTAGRQLASSSVSQPNDQEWRDRFLRQLNSIVQEVLERGQVTAVYLFSPKHMIRDVTEVLPKAAHDAIRSLIVGNFTRFHPFAFLKRIAVQTGQFGQRQAVQISEEVMKLLKTTETARQSA